MRKALQNVTMIIAISAFILANLIFVIGDPFIKVFNRTLYAQEKTLDLVVKSEKTSDDIAYIQEYISVIQTQTHRLATLTEMGSKVLPIAGIVNITKNLEDVSLELPQLLGEGRESDSVLLFLNNYELRPGGGFIGSLGFITFKDYTLTRFEVQDVYEIDGQLTTHNEPHFAVRRYLTQPNEFLRDSNFSPSFDENAKKALLYLSYVPAYKKPYVAVIGITTTGFEQLLKLTGPIELTDYNTTITSSNFFNTTQQHIENNFFAGSSQKRSILQSLSNVLQQKITQISIFDQVRYISDLVRTKNLVLYSPTESLQYLFENLNASGKLNTTNRDWVMPVDANVGVNKMDALIRKTMDLTITDDGNNLVHDFRSTYTNKITSDAQEKESYKNYFQLYVPQNAIIKKALLNNKDERAELSTAKNGDATVFGLYLEVPPASSSTLSITYELPKVLAGSELHFQKQTGSQSSPLTVIYKGRTTKVEQILLKSDGVFTLF